MSAVATAELLRPGLLEGVSILLAHAARGPREPPGGPRARESSRRGGPGPGDASLHAALTDSARATSARLTECELPVEEESFAQQLSEDGLPDLLVVDAAGVFAAAGEPARDALGRTMQLDLGGHPGRGRRPDRAAAAGADRASWPRRRVPAAGDAGARAVDARTHARATRAGLENLARTTSIEWARYGITTVAITPGAGTRPAGSLASAVRLSRLAGRARTSRAACWRSAAASVGDVAGVHYP